MRATKRVFERGFHCMCIKGDMRVDYGMKHQVSSGRMPIEGRGWKEWLWDER